MSAPERSLGVVNVVELNPYWPRPFVFSDAALCLRDSIRAAGFESEVKRDEHDPEAYCVVLGVMPELGAFMAGRGADRTAVYNLEQLSSGSEFATAELRRNLAQWFVFDYHSANVRQLCDENGEHGRVFEVPLVPGPSMRYGHSDADADDKQVDVLFYGSQIDRRSAVLDQLRERGASVEVVSGAYGSELAPAVRRARLVLHVHFYESGLFPVARVLQPVANRVPVVCETSVFPEACDWGASGIVFAPYESLADACVALLADPQRMKASAQQAVRFVETLDFASPFAAAMSAMQPPVPAHTESIVVREPGKTRWGAIAVWLFAAYIAVSVIMRSKWW